MTLQEIRPYFVQGVGLTLGALLILGVAAIIGAIIYHIKITRYKPEDLITPFSLYLEQLLRAEAYEGVQDCENVLEALKMGKIPRLLHTYQLQYLEEDEDEQFLKKMFRMEKQYDNDRYIPNKPTEQEEIKWVVLGRKAGYRYK